MRQQRFDLGSKSHSAIDPTVVERLLAGAVARQQQAPAPAIPNGEAEHAMQAFDASYAVLLVGVDDRFGVAISTEDVSFLSQLRAQSFVVPDLAVDDNTDIASFIRHRLMPAVEVDDAKACKAKTHRAVEVGSPIVRPSMGDQSHHVVDERRRNRFPASRVIDAADAAHDSLHPHLSCRWHDPYPRCTR